MFTLDTPKRVEFGNDAYNDYMQTWARLNGHKHMRRPMRSAVVAMINYAMDTGRESSAHPFDLIAY